MGNEKSPYRTLIPPKIIQIVCKSNELFALDEEGGFWRFISDRHGWRKLPSLEKQYIKNDE